MIALTVNCSYCAKQIAFGGSDSGEAIIDGILVIACDGCWPKVEHGVAGALRKKHKETQKNGK